jgi:alpha-beta hydrolase superfamily lysophospholipase
VLTHDQAVLDALAADPLAYHGSLRVRLGVEINRMAGRVRDQLPTLRLPILITYGDADTFVNPSGSTLTYERVGAADKTIIGYEGLRHEMHNESEPQRTQVLDDLANWIDARSP